jgi:preprotein translocase subunit SecE
MIDLILELVRFRRYKPNQGVLTRRLTAFGIFIIFASGAYRLYVTLTTTSFVAGTLLAKPQVCGGVSLAVALLGAWLAFRIVNLPVFANFLVSVEGEMMKVSWPSPTELYSSTVVVLTMFVILAGMIFVFDLAWLTLFKAIRVIP